MDAETYMPFGFCDVKVWNREPEASAKDHSHAKHLAPITEKESYKWTSNLP
jgi:hypothetical protein